MDKKKLKKAFIKKAKEAIEKGRITKEELTEMIKGGEDIPKKNKTTKRKRKRK